MKNLLLSLTVMLSLLASVSAEAYSCTAANARGFVFYGWASNNQPTGIANSLAGSRAMMHCQNSANTLNPATCRIVNCGY